MTLAKPSRDVSGVRNSWETEEMNADFYVETYSGSIKNQIGPSPTRADDYGPGKELRFSSGTGGARVSIESFSGSVKLIKR